MFRFKSLLLVLLFTLMLSSCGERIVINNKNESSPLIEEENSIKTSIIDIKGAIKYPGLYEVSDGISMYKLIEIAGGLTNSADYFNINMTKRIKGDQMVIIPSIRSSSNLNDNHDSNIIKSNTSSLININTATIDELCLIQGIGKTKASSIVSYRQDNGAFKTIDEIMNVSGIADELFARIKVFICV